MPILLDTHTFLWYVWGDNQLSETAKSLIQNSQHQKYVSIASIWEMAIKLESGKLNLKKDLDLFLSLHLDENGFSLLPIRRAHTLIISKLPSHHRDPFDRMLIAQSYQENMPIISIDKVFDLYDIVRYW